MSRTHKIKGFWNIAIVLGVLFTLSACGGSGSSGGSSSTSGGGGTSSGGGSTGGGGGTSGGGGGTFGGGNGVVSVITYCASGCTVNASLFTSNVNNMAVDGSGNVWIANQGNGSFNTGSITEIPASQPSSPVTYCASGCTVNASFDFTSPGPWRWTVLAMFGSPAPASLRRSRRVIRPLL